MIIYTGKDYYDVSRKAANIMSAQIIMKPNAVLGLATGSTPVGMYKQLIEWYKKGDLDFSQITSVNLDEYKGLSGDNDQSYRYFMNTNLFDHVNIDKARTYVPNGLEEDSEKACADYNEIIRSVGGIDLQLLGIGGNGLRCGKRIRQSLERFFRVVLGRSLFPNGNIRIQQGFGYIVFALNKVFGCFVFICNANVCKDISF